jgi:hypothetical protein
VGVGREPTPAPACCSGSRSRRPGALTDEFIVHSHDGGATWAENRLTPVSFDIEQAPVARGYFLGDYEGLASAGATFMPLFIQAETAPANPTDAFFTTVKP